MENMTKASPLAQMPGFEAMRAQQQAFFQGDDGWSDGRLLPLKEPQQDADDLDTIKQQLAAMQEKLSRMGK